MKIIHAKYRHSVWHKVLFVVVYLEQKAVQSSTESVPVPPKFPLRDLYVMYLLAFLQLDFCFPFISTFENSISGRTTICLSFSSAHGNFGISYHKKSIRESWQAQ